MGRAGAGVRDRPLRVHTGFGSAHGAAGTVAVARGTSLPAGLPAARLHPHQPVVGPHDLPAGRRRVVRRHLPADGDRGPPQAMAGGGARHRRRGGGAAGRRSAPPGQRPPLVRPLRPLPGPGARDREQRPRRRPRHPPRPRRPRHRLATRPRSQRFGGRAGGRLCRAIRAAGVRTDCAPRCSACSRSKRACSAWRAASQRARSAGWLSRCSASQRRLSSIKDVTIAPGLLASVSSCATMAAASAASSSRLAIASSCFRASRATPRSLSRAPSAERSQTLRRANMLGGGHPRRRMLGGEGELDQHRFLADRIDRAAATLHVGSAARHIGTDRIGAVRGPDPGAQPPPPPGPGDRYPVGRR